MKRSVVSIPDTSTIREAAAAIVDAHVGLLPIVDQDKKLVGVVGLGKKMDRPPDGSRSAHAAPPDSITYITFISKRRHHFYYVSRGGLRNASSERPG
jgi:CBS-domain-containing membrane protein